MTGKRAAIAAVGIAIFGLSAPSRADVVVSTASTSNIACSGGVCTPTARKAVLNVTDLANMLASGDVTVKSSALSQDIDFAAPLSWTSSQRLTLDTYRSIRFEKPIVVAGVGGLTITTNDGGTNGDFAFFGKGHVEFWDKDSSLQINGQNYALVRSVNELARLARNNGQPYIALAKTLKLGRTTYSTYPIPNLEATLEGLGNSVNDLKITSPGNLVGFIGTFEGLTTHAIRDINFISVNIVGSASNQTIGAVAGMCEGTVQSVSVTGSINASGTSETVGAIAGLSPEAIINSRADVTIVAGDNASAGGLVGSMEGTVGLVRNSFSTDSISAGNGSSVGGLAGTNDGAILSNSYSLASVTGGAQSSTGGLIGTNNEEINFPVLQSSYATGAVTAGSGSSIGGLIGTDIAGATNSNVYWDLDTSGISDPTKGAGNIANDPGLTGLTTAAFQSGLPAGFDSSVWGEKATINSGYPYLIANPAK